MRRVGRSLVLSVAAVVAVALAVAGPAAAGGPCGADQTGATACPVTTNGTLSGAIASGSEQDFYVFYVARATDLQLTVNDVEDPRCSSDYPYYPYICGWVAAELLDARGHELDTTQTSSPSNGIAVPASLTKSIGRGTYYLDVSGYVGPGTLPGIPYQLGVDGNPGVQWPPACIVPRLSSRTTLARSKHVLRNHRCGVGAVRYVRSSRTPRGDVIRLRPGTGSILTNGTPVAIYVSGQPPRHRRHRRHHRRH